MDPERQTNLVTFVDDLHSNNIWLVAVTIAQNLFGKSEDILTQLHNSFTRSQYIPCYLLIIPLAMRR